MVDPARDVGVFADRVLGRPLWAHQLEAARSGAFITVIAKARRTGGTELVKTLAAWTCFRERGAKAVILSAGQEASRRVTEELGAELSRSRLTRDAVADDFVTRIRLTNGSEIVSLPASQRAVRGLGRGVKLLVVDEAGFVPEELWRAAHYVALDERGSGSRIFLVGTPWGGPELFFRRAWEAGRDGDPDHVSFHWRSSVNSNLDQAYLERQRERVSPAEYAAEVLGEWSDAVGSLFPRELLERQTADIEVPELGLLGGLAQGILGLDWGVSFDRCAAAAIYRVPVQGLNVGLERRPVFVALPYVWPAGYPMIGDARRPGVVHEVSGCRARWAYVSAEVNGVGAGPTEALYQRMRGGGHGCKWRPVATTNAKKTAGYGCLLGLLESEQLVLPRHPDLLRQLAGLRFEQGERGFTRIGAEDPVMHDDVSDGLMLAALPWVPGGKGRVVCGLQRLALRFVEEATLPALEQEIVETGGGVRVYQRPVLQSVNGTAVTLPAGVRSRSEAAVDDWAVRARRAYNDLVAARAGAEED